MIAARAGATWPSGWTGGQVPSPPWLWGGGARPARQRCDTKSLPLEKAGGRPPIKTQKTPSDVSEGNGVPAHGFVFFLSSD